MKSLTVDLTPVDMNEEPWVRSARVEGRSVVPDIITGGEWPARHYLGQLRALRPVVGLNAPDAKWRHIYEAETTAGYRYFILANKPLIGA